MSFDKLAIWVMGIAIAAALTGQLDRFQLLIWKAQAKVLYESRTATWGSPRFFKSN